MIAFQQVVLTDTPIADPVTRQGGATRRVVESNPIVLLNPMHIVAVMPVRASADVPRETSYITTVNDGRFHVSENVDIVSRMLKSKL